MLCRLTTPLVLLGVPLWMIAAAAAASPETVLNESFESPQNRWRFAATRGKVEGALDAAEPAGGQSLRLDVYDPDGRATWSYQPRIMLKPSTAYRLQVKVMRVGVQTGGRAYLILYEDGIEAPSHWHTTASLTGTQDWQTATLVFTTRPDTSWARLQCKLWDSTGHAWFDDIRLDELPAAAATNVQQHRWPPPDDAAPLQLMWYPAHRRPDRTLHLVPGKVNPVSMFFWGRQEAIRDPHLILETPPQVKITGPVTCSREPVPAPLTLVPQPITHGGRSALRWRVPLREAELQRRLSSGGPAWTTYHFLYVEPQADCPSDFSWRWRTESGGQPGPEHEIAARLTEPQPQPCPRVPDFSLYVQHTDALRLPTREARRAVLDYLNGAAIAGGLALSQYHSDDAAIDRQLDEDGFFTWAWLWDGYSQRGGEPFPLVMDSTAVDRRKICPQAQVERAEPWWKLLQETYRKKLSHGATMLIINYEPPVFQCCFCPRCRTAFAAHAKRPQEQVEALTPQQLQQLPEHAWGRFRAWQNAQIVKQHVAAIHAIDPQVRVGLCGPPYSEWTADRGMDIRLFEPEVAFHAPMIYSVGSQFAGAVRATCEQTRTPVVPFVLASDLAVPRVFPTAAQLQANLLATAASGGGGAVLWVGIESLDGEYLHALRQAIQQIALIEPYRKQGKRIEGLHLEVARSQVRQVKVGDQQYEVSPQNSQLAVWQWAWQSPQGKMAVLLNYEQDGPRHVRLSAEGADKARVLFGAPLTRAQGRTAVTLPPGQATAILW